MTHLSHTVTDSSFLPFNVNWACWDQELSPNSPEYYRVQLSIIIRVVIPNWVIVESSHKGACRSSCRSDMPGKLGLGYTSFFFTVMVMLLGYIVVLRLIWSTRRVSINAPHYSEVCYCIELELKWGVTHIRIPLCPGFEPDFQRLQTRRSTVSYRRTYGYTKRWKQRFRHQAS